MNDIKWDESAEVVVVGYGAAGAIAAITANDAGSPVLVIEKQPEDRRYTNSNISGAVFVNPANVADAKKLGEVFWKADGNVSWTDHETIAAWAEYASQNKVWIESIGGGVKFLGVPSSLHLPGVECFEQYIVRGYGVGLDRLLADNIKSRVIPVMYRSSCQKLLADSSGRVTGLTVETTSADGEKRRVNIRASRAVILTCGGFEFNEEMKLNFLKVYPTYFYGTPANTGDGLKMVSRLGASLWHMNCCSARLGAKFPELPYSFSMDFGGRDWMVRLAGDSKQSMQVGCGYIVVDRNADRYTNENFVPHMAYYELTLFDSQCLVYPRIPSYWIFDQKRMDSGPLPLRIAGPSGPMCLYDWSRDNKSELDKGWIIQADTVGELARKLGLEPERLRRTVERYNTCCDNGEDRDFQRPPSYLVALRNPPYYAVRLWPGGPNTQGGPRRNHRAQIMNMDGDAIPGLYSAGEFGSIYGMNYVGGLNIAECIAFGRIAGENAAREKA